MLFFFVKRNKFYSNVDKQHHIFFTDILYLKHFIMGHVHYLLDITSSKALTCNKVLKSSEVLTCHILCVLI